jgi:hypothetical protein
MLSGLDAFFSQLLSNYAYPSVQDRLLGCFLVEIPQPKLQLTTPTPRPDSYASKITAQSTEKMAHIWAKL